VAALIVGYVVMHRRLRRRHEGDELMELEEEIEHAALAELRERP
jgi:hypothetical protein